MDKNFKRMKHSKKIVSLLQLTKVWLLYSPKVESRVNREARKLDTTLEKSESRASTINLKKKLYCFDSIILNLAMWGLELNEDFRK